MGGNLVSETETNFNCGMYRPAVRPMLLNNSAWWYETSVKLIYIFMDPGRRPPHQHPQWYKWQSVNGFNVPLTWEIPRSM